MLRSLFFALFLMVAYVCLELIAFSGGGELDLTWDPSSDSRVIGYKLYFGESSRNYIGCVDVGMTDYYAFDCAETDRILYFAVTAYDALGNESDYSEEIAAPCPVPSMVPNGEMSVVLVSSEESAEYGWYGNNAIDGWSETLWHTEWIYSTPPHPHYLVIDLGAVYLVEGFRYLPRQDGSANGTVLDYRFYVSERGIYWGEAVANGRFPADTQAKEVFFSAKIGRYIKFVALSEINGNNWASMAEINVFGAHAR